MESGVPPINERKSCCVAGSAANIFIHAVPGPQASFIHGLTDPDIYQASPVGDGWQVRNSWGEADGSLHVSRSQVGSQP